MSDEIDKLTKAGEAVDAAAACSDLRVGEEKSVTRDYTSVPSRYALKKDDDHTYEAIVKINFQPKGMSPGSEEFAARVQEMQTRTRECYSRVEPFLKGPGGRQLKITLVDPRDDRRAPVNDIAIDTALERADSADWNGTIDPKDGHLTVNCATVLHETFHLLGQVDEYPEMFIGYVMQPNGRFTRVGDISKSDSPKYAAWDCRSLGPSDSIMRSHESALIAVLGGRTVHTCQCADKKSEELCRQGFATVTEATTCGALRGKIDANMESYVEEEPNYGPIPAVRHSSPTSLKFVSPGKPPSRSNLLYPAEFISIVAPGCSVNSDFYGCANNAMRTSTGNHGEGCKDMPRACQGGKTDWITMEKS